jgi:hypothetical protein
MLVTHKIEEVHNLKPNIVKRKSKKSQIMLFDTQRRFDDYVAKIRFRKDGKHEDIPHFIINKFGDVYEVFDTNYSSNTFDKPQLDRKQIKIALENLGWLSKNTITGYLYNWIGDPCRTDPFIKSWRNYFFWDKYTNEQMLSLSELCDLLCEKHEIFKQVVPSQGYLERVDNFKGVVCKSNFSNIYTDINPSFNFRILFNDEKYNNRI